MAEAQARTALPRSLEEFVGWHARQPERWEFLAGRPVMMAPASKAHTMIKGNIFAALRVRLEGGPCTPFTDGVELRAFGQSAIPDVVVTCDPPDLASPVEDRPTLIVEVLSPGSEQIDQVVKWERYRRYESLRHYLIVWQDRPLVLLHSRHFHSNGAPFVWEERFIEEGGVPLEALSVSLPLAEIYRGVPLQVGGDG